MSFFREITLSGTLEWIKEQAEELLTVFQNAESEGYAPTEDPEAEWTYITMQDEVVCDICRPLHGDIYTTDELAGEFPFFTIESAVLLKPHTHMPRDDNCRCELQRVEDGGERAFQLIDIEIDGVLTI